MIPIITCNFNFEVLQKRYLPSTMPFLVSAACVEAFLDSYMGSISVRNKKDRPGALVNCLAIGLDGAQKRTCSLIAIWFHLRTGRVATEGFGATREPRKLVGGRARSGPEKGGFSHRAWRTTTREPTSISKSWRNWGSEGSHEEEGLCSHEHKMGIGKHKQKQRLSKKLPPVSSPRATTCAVVYLTHVPWWGQTC